MNESLTKRILAHLAECGVEMVEAFFPEKYPETRLSRRLLGCEGSCSHKFSLQERRSISSILSRLRRDGLVARFGSRKRSLWRVTRAGRAWLQRPGRMYVRYVLPREDGRIRLVTFDIPERERKKRNWLRIQLNACGFRQLQKSVWIGTRPLPEDFIEHIDILRLSDYVHIVSVNARGTLKMD